MDRKLHRPEEVRMRQSEKDRNPYSYNQSMKHIDYNDDFDGEIEEREEEIEERNDTAGGIGAWGGS